MYKGKNLGSVKKLPYIASASMAFKVRGTQTVLETNLRAGRRVTSMSTSATDCLTYSRLKADSH